MKYIKKKHQKKNLQGWFYSHFTDKEMEVPRGVS